MPEVTDATVEEAEIDSMAMVDLLPFEEQVLQRLRDIDKRLAAVEGIVGGRTKLFNRILDGFGWACRSMGGFASTVLDRFTNPTRGFIVVLVIIMLSVGGMTVADVFDLGKMASGWYSAGASPEEDAPPSELPD